MVEGEAGKLHRFPSGRSFSFPEPDSLHSIWMSPGKGAAPHSSDSMQAGAGGGGEGRGKGYNTYGISHTVFQTRSLLPALAGLGDQSDLHITMCLTWARALVELP